MLALVLAGGRGLRLSPYTRVLPKPLLPVGDRPVLAVLLERLRLAGIRRVVISLGYLGELIRTYFGEGERAGMELSYLVEKEPLGTAGPIRLLPRQEEPFLVVNGDILPDLPFADLYRVHREEGAAMTVAAREHRFRLEYGLLKVTGRTLLAWEEKPCLSALIGIGVYVVEPEVQDLCPPGRVEIPELVRRLLAAGRRVVVYPTEAYWRDIGTPEEFHAVNESPPEFVRLRQRPEGGMGFAARERDHSPL
ncbi:MAG: NTP transferase domain-containing protein [Firmicutes bacterium]|nr:NTP transferase domain-containing protein [Bacillota bacterium]